MLLEQLAVSHVQYLISVVYGRSSHKPLWDRMRVTFAARLRSYLFYLFTFTYSGALYHYTIDPIDIIIIASNQNRVTLLRTLMYDFKVRKEQELQFVQRAVRLPLPSPS